MIKVAIISLVAGCIATLGSTSTVSAEGSRNPSHIYGHYRGESEDIRRMRAPQLGAAHAVSLSSTLTSEFSDKERDQIRKSGPWLSDFGLSQNAQVLIRAIQDARVHGLNPENYHLAQILSWVDLLSHMDQMRLNSPRQQDGDWYRTASALKFQLNALLDGSFINLAEHLGHGVVDGRKLQKGLFRDVPDVNAFNMLVSISNAELSVSDALASVTQSHPDYQRLTWMLRDLLTEQATDIARTRVSSDNDAQPIATTSDKQRIRERLLEAGDLSLDAYMAANADAELLKALRVFQSRNGIEQSSFADEATRAAMNRSVYDDIEAVAISLERWRWLPRDLGSRHIFVNIPNYRVNLMEGGKTELSMAAVVGKYEHQTPSFTREMSYMEFNPTWTVPVSITNKELIPKERRRPGYLVSRDFDFLKRVGNQLVKVPANSVTKEELNMARFPYTLRQRGGPINALGRMKFMMPNPYSIYLHDTQAKKHFTLNDRAYSHGCIRLSDPDTLALHLMLGDDYSLKEYDQALRSKKTHRVRFRHPIPTHLVYLTTWVSEDGALQYRPDIYRHDDKLVRALRASDKLLTEAMPDGRLSVASIGY